MKLYRIKNWCQAYPIEVFPEPDFEMADSDFYPETEENRMPTELNKDYLYPDSDRVRLKIMRG